MSQRAWPAPAGGRTVQLIGDLHTEIPSVAHHTRHEALLNDMRRLTKTLPPLSARVQVGDACHNMVQGHFDAQLPLALNTFATLDALDGTPRVGVAGNHDLNFGGTSARAVQLGYPAGDYVTVIDGIRYVCHSPVNQTETAGTFDGQHTSPDADWVVPQSSLTWMDSAIGNDDTPTVLVCHCPPYEQYNDATHGYYLTPVQQITDIIAAHPSVVAFMSGHRHKWYHAVNLFKSVAFGTHNVALIQAGCCGGTIDASMQPDGHPVESVRTNGSVFASYFGPDDPGGHRWELRVRDHSAGTWGTATTNYRSLWTVNL